jgi:hypothetical protein
MSGDEPEATPGETLPGHPPAGVFGPFAIALAALGIALATWTLSFVREEATDNTVDPAAVLLRIVALALTIRALGRLTRSLRQVAAYLSARRQRLHLGPSALTLTSGEGKLSIARDDIVAIREEGAFGERSRPSYARVFVISSGARAFVEIAPIFDASATALAERLMRWLGPPRVTPPSAVALTASREYDEAAGGRLGPGVTAFRHGYAWLKRGPYASLLVGVAFLDSLLRSQTMAWSDFRAWLVPIILVALLVVPLGWIAITSTILRPRKGLSLVVTPSRVLLRTERGTMAVPYETVARVGLHERRSWSIVDGLHWTRALVIERRNETPIRYDEAFLGAPIEVVIALIEARRSAAARSSGEGASEPPPELPGEQAADDEREAGDSRAEPD